MGCGDREMLIQGFLLIGYDAMQHQNRADAAGHLFDETVRPGSIGAPEQRLLQVMFHLHIV